MPTIQEFRDLCHRHGLTATHQRQVIFEAVMALHGMTEEAILAAVRLASVCTAWQPCSTLNPWSPLCR
jgi:Fe2+ or Zn2+ uptake regulation protein